MQTTYAHPDVFTAGTGVRTLKFIVGANGETVMVDLEQRSVTSKCELFGATTTVALGKSSAEAEITVHTAFNAELRFGINFETGAVTPLGDSVISFPPALSMASHMIKHYYGGTGKTLVVTQGPPLPTGQGYDSSVPLFIDEPHQRFGCGEYAKGSIIPEHPLSMEEIYRQRRYPDRLEDHVIRPFKGLDDLKP